MQNVTTSSVSLSDWAQGQVVGFTASRAKEPFRRLKDEIEDHFRALHTATQFVTGGCVGGDHFIGETLFNMYPEHRHTVVVPADRSRVVTWWERYDSQQLKLVVMAPDTTYRDRNWMLAEWSDRMLGYPLYGMRDARSHRSGTWQTLRLANNRHDVEPMFYLVGALA